MHIFGGLIFKPISFHTFVDWKNIEERKMRRL